VHGSPAVGRHVDGLRHEVGERAVPQLVASDDGDAELVGARPVGARVRERFEARVSQGRGATDLTDIARAATFGAVDTLLADIDQTVPGYVDEESGAVTLDDSDDAANYGVVDELARRVLLSGGRVLALRADDIPGDTATAAILRYPV